MIEPALIARSDPRHICFFCFAPVEVMGVTASLIAFCPNYAVLIPQSHGQRVPPPFLIVLRTARGGYGTYETCAVLRPFDFSLSAGIGAADRRQPLHPIHRVRLYDQPGP
jgi:hypothetical protein